MIDSYNRNARKRLPACWLWLLAVAVYIGSAQVHAAADEKPDSITVGTWNLEWFYDHYQGDNRSELSKKRSAPDREEWQWKLRSVR